MKRSRKIETKKTGGWLGSTRDDLLRIFVFPAGVYRQRLMFKQFLLEGRKEIEVKSNQEIFLPSCSSHGHVSQHSLGTFNCWNVHFHTDAQSGQLAEWNNTEEENYKVIH